MLIKPDICVFGKKPVVIIMIMLLLSVSCGFSDESQLTAPKRDFSRPDLLIQLSALPGWEMDSTEISELAPNPLGIKHNLGGSSISFLIPGVAGAVHLVLQFPNADDSARAYRSHDFTRNTNTSQWEMLDGFNYMSQAADQFRVVCEEMAQTPVVEVEICAIEAQYDEFISIVFYSGMDQDVVVSDLTLLAKAVDAHMVNLGLGK